MAATEVVKLTLETKRELEARKIHPRETIDDVIRRLAGFDEPFRTIERLTLDEQRERLGLGTRTGEAKS